MGRRFSEVRRAAPATFNAPLKWKEPAKVFTCSISDFFIDEADQWRDEAWEIIRRTPHLTYQILTKRPERIAEHLPKTCYVCGETGKANYQSHEYLGWPWPNVWLGTSVETQQFARERIPRLVEVPAVVHFLSCEPLLGPIELNFDPYCAWYTDIEWVIAGGESGPEHREMDPAWARGIRDQCLAAKIPFFFKQSSGPRSEMNPVLDGREWREMPSQR